MATANSSKKTTAKKPEVELFEYTFPNGDKIQVPYFSDVPVAKIAQIINMNTAQSLCLVQTSEEFFSEAARETLGTKSFEDGLIFTDAWMRAVKPGFDEVEPKK